MFLDEKSGLYLADFNSDGLVLDTASVSEIGDVLGSSVSQGRIHIGFVIHEPYFYPEYKRYQRDYAGKIEAAVRLMTENGYAPIFYEEYLPENGEAQI